MSFENIVILTGAGISAESGIKTFRDANGLWENHKVEEVATYQGFMRDKELVYRFYNERRKQLLSNEVKENPAHLAIGKLQKEFSGNVTVVTQNIDDLHERGGAEVLHMHGELLKVRCEITNGIYETREDINSETMCKCCLKRGTLRPHVVWFGEIPLYMEQILKLTSSCDLFVSIGTSGQVYPAAGLVQLAKDNGAFCVEANLEETGITSDFDIHLIGKAGDTVPSLVECILSARDLNSLVNTP